MFRLYGVFDLGYHGESVQVVADFSSLEKAQEYVRRSQLSRPRRDGSKFKSNSLLERYHDYNIEYIEIGFPVDPEI